jgi:ABC transporter substrate binding protein (PQQ-dependent alcohol dehydrogenase system)
MTRLLAFLLCVLTMLPFGLLATERSPILYVDRAEDPAYQPRSSYAGIARREPQPPVAGAELGIQDSRAIGRAIGREFALVRRTLAPQQDAAPAVRAALEESGAIAAILDLPTEDTLRVAEAVKDSARPLFNARHRETEFRQRSCATRLFHVIASEAMLADALSQYLSFKNWRQVLVLEGGEPGDLALSQAFQRAAKKFGLRIVAVKRFELGRDPRRREATNVALLTGDTEHDVVFVAEATPEFARKVPYQTAKPRPVVGAEGLMPSAWHGAWERHGAPQLNRRFERLAGRAMTDEDWAAWAAVRALVAAVSSPIAGGASKPDIIAALLRQDLPIELYKGTPGSFRPWDRQLRQPILLHTQTAVIERAPLEGFLHQHNTLDTLGLDAPEFRCGGG